MKFEALKPGMRVYDVGRSRLGNTTLKTISVWPVHIESVDAATRTVTARWNCNPARKFPEKSYSKWRKEAPMLVGGVVKRLATRAEIAAAKAAAEQPGSTQ